MNKFLLLSILFLSLGNITLIAQQPGTQCNAAFNFIINQGNQVQFIPTQINTGATLQHRWHFGDGTPESALTSPLHTYLPGFYNVLHEVFYRSPNDSTLVLCRDSAIQTIVISGSNNCTLVPRFEFRRDSLQPNKVYFFNRSTGMQGNVQVLWNFGNGITSTLQNPVITYTASGLYNVCLQVRDTFCNRESCQPVQVQVPVNSCTLQPNYASRPDSANPLKIYFNNLTAGITATDTVRWSFGDGTGAGTLHADHTYAQAGTYTVCLIIKRPVPAGLPPCVRELCRQVIVPPANPCTLQVYLTAEPSPVNPLQWSFTSYITPSANSDSLFWTFGDGGTATGTNPSHAYNQGGTYTVCLRVKRMMNANSAPCVVEYCKLITVQQPNACNLQVNFSSITDSNNLLKIHFTNLSTGSSNTDTLQWTFGDGSASTQPNPVHTYSQQGTYTVCLRIKRAQPNGSAPCVRESCRSIVVPAPVFCNLQVNFEMVRDTSSSGTGQGWRFYNTSQPLAATDSCFWNFGDNTPPMVTTGAVPYVVHHYANNGFYPVCLRIKKMLPGTGNVQCERQVCRSVGIQNQPAANCDSLLLDFVFRRDGYMPNKFFFFATSNPPLIRQQWTFSRQSGGTPVLLNQYDPVFVFPDTGLYNVCVKGTYMNGCEKSVCKPIRVERIAPAGQCMLYAFPNPARLQVSVNVQLDRPSPVYLSIVNSQQIVVQRAVRQGVTGNNLFTLNIQQLPVGFYTMRIVYGNRICYSRFQKFL